MPAPPIAPPGVPLTSAQIEVLRKMVTVANFRQAFVADAVKAVCDAGIRISAAELARLASLTADQLEQLATGLTQLSQGTSPGGAAAGTNTLLYAIVVALLLAQQ